MVQLVDIANARCGDKGDKVNIALFAKSPEHYALLEKYVTADKVATHFAGLVHGQVRRFDVPNLSGMNFVLDEALAGGGSASLRVDNLGKCFASNLLRMTITNDEGVDKYATTNNNVKPCRCRGCCSSKCLALPE